MKINTLLEVDGYADLQQHEIRNVLLHQLGSDPSSPEEGQFWERANKFWVVLNGDTVQLATMDDVTAGGLSESLFNAKGDLLVGTADNEVGVLTVGADGTFLVAASAETTGQKWRALANGDVVNLLATNDLSDWPRVAALDLAGQKITSLADGTATTDGATYGQLLAVMEGKRWKDPVVAATTANVTLASALENGDTLDGVTLATGDRVLAKDQTTQTENGIYTVNASGAPTRAVDANTGAELTRATVIITGGTTNKGDVYTQSATISNVASDNQTWAKTGEGNQTYSADGSTIDLSGSTFSVKAGGIGPTQLATDAVTAVKMADASVDLATATVTGVLPTANGGLGSGTMSTARDNLAGGGGLTTPRKFAAALSGGSQTEIVTHGLGTRDVVVAVYVNGSTFPEEGFDILHTSTTTITVGVASGDTIAASTYRVVVIG